ncbi:VOC family protein [Paraglaciecola sp.]|uniref:VOC family protein n=1 Tax=Paraglaciecola sp. TaxID=1920173 RepID=UPI00273E3D19|nr:VOC family protein [Paraglaciecola sp.]MDP5030392.1 VOC family protein [Paraglaciecola sp.]
MHFFKNLIAVSAILIAMSDAAAIEVDKDASINDTSTTIMGINHIGLSVKNLDQALAFYQRATGFELIKREKVFANKNADVLWGGEDLQYEVATLKAPNMLFEITEFALNKNVRLTDMPVQGPGMTHTCFQSPEVSPGYTKFVKAGTRMITKGNIPVDIGGYGVTYAYGYDPEGNIFELEQLDGAVLTRAGYDKVWQAQGYNMWMSQVSFATADIDNLMGFYEKVLGFKPYRTNHVTNNPKVDSIANISNGDMLAGWFKLNDKSKVMEFWQFKTPKTEHFIGTRKATDLGYSYSLEVGNIQQEYERLVSLGVDFISNPQRVGEFFQAYARDVDGNIFSLRQAVDAKSQYSIVSFDIPG